ncbi:Hypothetical_protein [Hexamita inflata]|uniref:Hypothetical_protein n=1 Tax=Hexamita inflata TaxID=28002 RepID=A0AA86U116_9EUKA|nr:Hypothetical protein HINF_LOCUS23804 [Hexamita inflata]
MIKNSVHSRSRYLKPVKHFSPLLQHSPSVNDINNSMMMQRNSDLYLASVNIQSYATLDFGLNKLTLGLDSTDERQFYKEVETLNSSFNSTQLILDIQSNIRKLNRLLETIKAVQQQDLVNQDEFQTMIKIHKLQERDFNLYCKMRDVYSPQVL